MEYLAAALLAAEIIYCTVCAARLRKDGQTGRLAAWVAALCAASDLAFLLPRLLAKWLLPELPFLWIGMGALADGILSTVAWLLLYLAWERAYAGGVRDRLVFWTAMGGALLRLLAWAASAANLLRGTDTRFWVLVRLFPLCFLASAAVAAWRSVRQTSRALRWFWLLLIAALALRFCTAALDSKFDSVTLRLPLLFVHTTINACLFTASKK